MTGFNDQNISLTFSGSDLNFQGSSYGFYFDGPNYNRFSVIDLNISDFNSSNYLFYVYNDSDLNNLFIDFICQAPITNFKKIHKIY